MLIYILSFVLFVVALGLGYISVRKFPKRAERTIGRIVFVAFVCQILVNWLFWSKGVAYNPWAGDVSAGHGSLNFLVLCLVSIFCYSGLLTILLKAHDFYNEPSEV